MTQVESFPSPALQRGHPPATRLVRPPAWIVPVELPLALSRSAGVQVLRARFAGGDPVDPAAKVVQVGGRFYAMCKYGRSERAFLTLDVWTLEAQR